MKQFPPLNKSQYNELSATINDRQCSTAEVKKAQAILMLSTKKTPDDILLFTGYKERTAQGLRKAYLTVGFTAIKDKPKKMHFLLTSTQRGFIINALRTQKPSDSGYSGDIWSISILARMIKDKFGVVYKSKTPFYLLFKEARFTFHKPDTKYQRRDEEAVQAWIKATKPIIEAAFNDPDVVILAEDEMHLSSQTTTQRVWLKSGEYQNIEVATKRKSKSIYGFIDIKTGSVHAYKADWQNMYITKKILQKIVRLCLGKTILLVWDQAGWHKGSVVQEYIDSLGGKIKIIYFPAASPDLNPQEHVWKAGRSAVTHNKFIEDIDKTSSQFVKYLNKAKFKYSLLGFGAKLEN